MLHFCPCSTCYTAVYVSAGYCNQSDHYEANWILGIISDVDSLPRLYKALVHPVIEYANSIWGPFYIGDQRMLEKVQKCDTWLIPSLRDLPYSEQLAHLRLPSLYYRRKRGDMMLVYQ